MRRFLEIDFYSDGKPQAERVFRERNVFYEQVSGLDAIDI
jgi:hypothetical protein